VTASVLDHSLAAVGLDPSGLVGSGQVEVLDRAQWRAQSGGEAARLYELYLDQVRRAGPDGFPGVALTGDERALRALARDDVELIAHERDIDRLVADQGVRALCRYPVRDGWGVLPEILRLHYRDVVDDLWQATVVADRLLVRGEIEASNVDRFDVVVRAAVTAGASTVDPSGVEFFSAASVRALFSAADLLHQRGRPLVLLDPQVSHVKALALEFLAEHPAVELNGKKGGVLMAQPDERPRTPASRPLGGRAGANTSPNPRRAPPDQDHGPRQGTAVPLPPDDQARSENRRSPRGTHRNPNHSRLSSAAIDR
jgi:anti-anti-sigma regulatory factor